MCNIIHRGAIFFCCFLIQANKQHVIEIRFCDSYKIQIQFKRSVLNELSCGS